MGFHETRFPVDVSYGSRGGPGFMTNVVVLDSGQEQRVARWNGARRRYNAAQGIRSYQNLADVTRFYLARRGVANGFRYKDWLDYATTADGMTTAFKGTVDVSFDDQVIGTGDGSTVQFQLIKRYTWGSETRVRNITKPVEGTTRIGLDGVETTAFTVNTTTGLVTFTAAPGSNVNIAGGCEFDVPVRFGKEVDEELSMDLDDFGSGSIEDIPLVELVDPEETADEFFYGGAKTHDPVTGNITLSVGSGRVQVFKNIDVNGHDVFMPDSTNLPPGGPYFHCINDDSVNSIDLVDEDLSTLLYTLPADSAATIVLNLDGATKRWYVLT